MAQENKSDLIKEFLDLTPLDKEIRKDFSELLNFPDEKFKVAVVKVRDTFDAVFKDPSYQDTVLSTIRTTGVDEDFSADMDILKEYLDRVKESDLSQEKKDFIDYFLTNTIMAVTELVEVPRRRIEVEIKKLSENAKLPEYAHLTDAGADIFALEDTTIEPNETKLVKTGIAVAIPVGYAILIYPRSGLSLKTGLRIANSVGVIDSDYRNELCVILQNTDNQSYTINKGDRIAQMIITEVPMIKWKETENLSNTDREGGFGSTGK